MAGNSFDRASVSFNRILRHRAANQRDRDCISRDDSALPGDRTGGQRSQQYEGRGSFSLCRGSLCSSSRFCAPWLFAPNGQGVVERSLLHLALSSLVLRQTFDPSGPNQRVLFVVVCFPGNDSESADSDRPCHHHWASDLEFLAYHSRPNTNTSSRHRVPHNYGSATAARVGSSLPYGGRH